MKQLIRAAIVVLAGLIVGVFADIAFAKDIVPLRHGFFVSTDTKCEDASKATINLFLGNAFQFNCSVKSTKPIGNNTYKITELCTKRDARETTIGTYRIISSTEYIFRWDNSEDHFRYCPQSSLPEPWRSFRVSALPACVATYITLSITQNNLRFFLSPICDQSAGSRAREWGGATTRAGRRRRLLHPPAEAAAMNS
jgi:hypothetical protein